MAVNEISVEELYKSDDKLKRDDVRVILEWMEKRPHLPKITELMAALFLHSCYYSIEAAKTTIDIHFTVKTLAPEMHAKRTLDDPLLRITTDTILMALLPKRTPSGDVVLVGKIISSCVDDYHLASHLKLIDIVISIYLHQFGPGNGLHIVADADGLLFGHILKMNPNLFRKFFYYLQEGMPVRVKSFHFINIVPYIDKLMALMKPFMKKELADVLMLHQGVDPIFKYIPQDVFPRDYGGSSPSLNELKENSKRLIAEHEKFLKYEETLLVDESKRSEKPKDIEAFFGTDGTFKKIDFD